MIRTSNCGPYQILRANSHKKLFRQFDNELLKILIDSLECMIVVHIQLSLILADKSVKNYYAR